jgi:hypothetical protein
VPDGMKAGTRGWAAIRRPHIAAIDLGVASTPTSVHFLFGAPFECYHVKLCLDRAGHLMRDMQA